MRTLKKDRTQDRTPMHKDTPAAMSGRAAGRDSRRRAGLRRLGVRDRSGTGDAGSELASGLLHMVVELQLPSVGVRDVPRSFAKRLVLLAMPAGGVAELSSGLRMGCDRPVEIEVGFGRLLIVRSAVKSAGNR